MSPETHSPVPQGNYLPAVRHGDIIYTSGMTPREDGKLLYAEKMRHDVPLDSYKSAVRLSTHNALAAANTALEAEERLSAVLQLTVYLNTEQGFTAHPKVADFASELLVEELGTSGIGSRAAIGVATLPSNAMVEISLVVTVVKNR